MKVLLDSHTIIWAVDAPARLGPHASSVLTNPAHDLILSAATIWELAIKVGLGKLTLSSPYRQWMSNAIRVLNVIILPITVEYADVLSALPNHHRDPFDRLLIAQSQVENLVLVSNDSVFDQYPITRIW